MKKILISTIALSLILTMVACGESNSNETGFSTAPIEVSTAEKESTTADLSNLPADPPYDFNIDEMLPKDFGKFFEIDYENNTISEYTISEGDSKNTVTVIDSGVKGPEIYVIAGIHGNEEAAWQTGKLLKKITIKTGKLYILAPANPWGANSTVKKREAFGEDMNRLFPGNPNGTTAERYVSAIYRDVESKKPDFVFDLHEAIVIESNRDFLGSSIVFSDMDLFPDNMVLDIIDESGKGKLCKEAFNYYSPGPAGSINNVITTNLQIPTLTIETFRGYEMENRLYDQLDIIQYVLRDYGMVD